VGKRPSTVAASAHVAIRSVMTHHVRLSATTGYWLPACPSSLSFGRDTLTPAGASTAGTPYLQCSHMPRRARRAWQDQSGAQVVRIPCPRNVPGLSPATKEGDPHFPSYRLSLLRRLRRVRG
jgi:hypothetical protein